MVIEVDGGMVQDVSIELRTGQMLAVPEVVVKDRDVEGKEDDEVSTDADGEHVLIPMAVNIKVLD
jgi:hypothetical protein